MKRIVRALLSRLGYQIVRIEKPFKSGGKKRQRVKVWDYFIYMPSSNTLRRTYKIYPDFNIHLSRLATIINKKYPGMTIVDIGANVGDTIAVLRSVTDSPIIGVEGDEVSYKYLEANTKQFTGISILKTFLGDKNQDLNVKFENAGWNTTIIPTNTSSNKISLKTMDEVFQQENFLDRNIKLIKIDAEGFDTIVLRGAINVIKMHSPVLFFEYNQENMKKIGEEGLSTVLSFKNCGYDRIAFFDYLGKLFLDTSLENLREIAALDSYLNCKNNLFGYYDVCIFHKHDNKMAEEFLEAEKANNRSC